MVTKRLVCRSCGYSVPLTEREAELGILCPECHCCRLREKIKERKGRRLVTLRPATVRALIGGGIGLVAGPVLTAVGIANLGGKAGILWARVVGIGLVFTIAAIISLVMGLVGLFRDLQ
jgi:hypothetical protein